MNIVKTGFLNYVIDVDHIKEILKAHPLKAEILKFKPKAKNRKSFNSAYAKYLHHQDVNLDLTKFGFRAEVTSSEAFGTKTFYKHDKEKFKTFFYAEIFEAVHLNLV